MNRFLSSVLMKDRCKLFCRVAGTMAYYQLKDRVIDGTPCGPDTYDICVQGLCRVHLAVVFCSWVFSDVSKSESVFAKTPTFLWTMLANVSVFKPSTWICHISFCLFLPLQQAGCDHVLNSKARNDKCGVCGGDNSSCKTLAGTFNDAQYGKPQSSRYSYS